MPARSPHLRKLIVEGVTDKRVVPYLMEANGVTWPKPPHHPVEIESWDSIDEILKPEAINNQVKEPGREALGCRRRRERRRGGPMGRVEDPVQQ